MVAALTQLIPMQELPPGSVTAIRTEVIKAVLALASRELRMPEEKLIVRDIRPFGDLQIYLGGTTDATSERWGYAATGTTIGYTSITGDKTMGDQRFVAIFGARDRGRQNLASGSATLAAAFTASKPVVSFIKIKVGGADKVIWDTTSMYAYENAVAVSSSAVIIPQNILFNIQYYRMGSLEVGTTTGPVTDEISWLQLIGVTVEPRGLVVSP